MDKYRIPSHGRGRLLTGGKIGNRGGSGRPPCAIKALCRENFEKGLQSAAKIVAGQKVSATGDQPTNADVIRALNVLGRYGFAETDNIMPAHLIPVVTQVFSEYLPPESQRPAVERFIELLGNCPED